MPKIEDSFLTIESDGFGRGTRVVLPGGEDIGPLMRSIAWSVGPDQVARVSLEMLPAKLLVKVPFAQDALKAMLEAAGFEVRVKEEEG